MSGIALNSRDMKNNETQFLSPKSPQCHGKREMQTINSNGSNAHVIIKATKTAHIREC